MIAYPKLKAKAHSRQRLESFKGYDCRQRTGSGGFCQMQNLTSDDYPVLSTRKKRGWVTQLPECIGMYFIPEIGLLYVVRHEEEAGEWAELQLLCPAGERLVIADTLNTKPKQFALMGRKLVIAPDMRYVDLNDLTATYEMEERWTVSAGSVTVKMCDAEGYLFQNVTVSTEPPSAPGYHQLWLCNAVGSEGLKQYEPSSGEWISIEATYLKISGLGEHQFQAGDGVELSGFSDFNINGSYVIRSIGHGDIVIPGLIYAEVTQDCAKIPISVHRQVPQLDFVVESGNRLWGCNRGTNEIYACKLGNIKNWNCFQGLSTDSWVGTVGTPGEFTGAVVQNGYPIFYKEDCKHKVWPSASGAHQITVLPCDGVQKGCENSLAVREGTVFYQSPAGVRADDGGGPVDIGQCLGEGTCEEAAGGISGQKYYLSQKDSDGNSHLLVYDMNQGLWHREDDGYVSHFATGDGSLYASMGTHIWDLTGNRGEKEETVHWMAVTGDLGLELPEQKYITRLTLRLMLEPGACLEIYAQYDRDPIWVRLGQVYGTDLRSISLPVRPRRCDQLRLKLQGSGMCKLYSITETLEKGSELT